MAEAKERANTMECEDIPATSRHFFFFLGVLEFFFALVIGDRECQQIATHSVLRPSVEHEGTLHVSRKIKTCDHWLLQFFGWINKIKEIHFYFEEPQGSCYSNWITGYNSFIRFLLMNGAYTDSISVYQHFENRDKKAFLNQLVEEKNTQIWLATIWKSWKTSIFFLVEYSIRSFLT